MVETHSRRRADEVAAQWTEPPMRQVAFSAAHVLTDVTLPRQSLSRPDGFLMALGKHAEEAAARYEHWPLVSWRVDDVPVPARLWRFAGAWAVVSDAVDEVYLAVVGLGTGPDGLDLARLQDGTAYHFGLDQPLSGGLRSASAQAAGVDFEAPRWQRQDWHADQLRLMCEPEDDRAE